MKVPKVRCQLYLPKSLSDRVNRIAAGTGRPRSELLVEALEAMLNGRDQEGQAEVLAARLTRFERHVEAVRRHQGLQWEVMARMLRHQLVTGAALPPADAALQAAAARQFEAVLDEIADRISGKEPPEAEDAGIARIRALH